MNFFRYVVVGTNIFFLLAAISDSCLTKICVTLDFLRHINTLEDSLFVDVDSLDVTPGLSQIESETEIEQDGYGKYLQIGPMT